MGRSLSQKQEAPNLQRLHLGSIDPNSNILFIGKRHSGKGNFFKYLVTHLCSETGFGKIVVCSGTESMNHFYEEDIHVDKDFIRSTPDVPFLKRVYICQCYIASKLTKADKQNKKNWMLIVLDDITFDEGFRRSPLMQEMMFNGRHGLTVVCQLGHNAMAAAVKNTRDCYDIVLCSRVASRRSITNLWEEYFGMFPDKEMFRETFMKYTTNWSMLVKKTKLGGADKIEEEVFWARAPNLDNLKPKVFLDYTSLEPFREFIRGGEDVTTTNMKKELSLLTTSMRESLKQYYSAKNKTPSVMDLKSKPVKRKQSEHLHSKVHRHHKRKERE